MEDPISILGKVLWFLLGSGGMAYGRYMKSRSESKIESLTEEYEEKLEELRFQIAVKKEETDHRFAKILDLQIAAVKKLNQIETALNQKLHLFLVEWRVYFHEIMEEPAEIPVLFNKNYGEIKRLYQELMTEYKIHNVYLPDKIIYNYESIIQIYGENMGRIDRNVDRYNLIITSKMRFSMKDEKGVYGIVCAEIKKALETKMSPIKDELNKLFKKYFPK